MMLTGNGINTVTVNGKVKHITELDDITLCLEWTKLREENNRLYEINGTVAKLAMRQPFVLFKGLTFQKLCL
ncbi:hypothetical protein PCJ39_27625, partial [Klebsiella pneumoniae]|nr:hypothetical protein [Klebsiella pneumoniae]